MNGGQKSEVRSQNQKSEADERLPTSDFRRLSSGQSAALPLPLAREVEAAYQRFESAWRAGQRP